MTAPAQYKWFFETTTPVEGHMHAIARTITTRQTKFQFMEIMETHSYGKCLVLDGRIQSSQADEFIYHELLVQPGLLAHPRPERAMVIGGGEGATVREILRHRSITDCLMVDIDGEVVEECKKHLPEMHQGAFDDPRTRLLHEDARAYLEKTSDRFDLIVVDLVEPLEEGPACLLFTKEFYTLIRDRLTDRGVMTMQAGMTKVNEVFFYGAVNRTLREVFPVVAPYQGFISCFGTPWGFILASKGEDPRRQSAADIDRLIAERLDPTIPRVLGRAGPPALLQPAEVPAPGDRDERPRHHGRQPPDRHLSSARAAPSYLASASPRRQELLAQLGIAFTVLPSHIPEEHPPGPPTEAIAAVALAKARAVALRLSPDARRRGPRRRYGGRARRAPPRASPAMPPTPRGSSASFAGASTR